MFLFPQTNEEDTKLFQQDRWQPIQPRSANNQLPLHRLHARKEKAKLQPLTIDNNGRIGTGIAIGAARFRAATGKAHGPGGAQAGPIRAGSRQDMLSNTHSLQYLSYLEELTTFGII